MSVETNPARKILVWIDTLPRAFWLLQFGLFISAIGTTLYLPFLALYLTRSLSLSPVTVSSLLASPLVTGLLASTVGGWFTDYVGRKPTIIVGLCFEVVSIVGLAFASSVKMAFILIALSGLSRAANPAIRAAIVDVVPQQHLSQAYAAQRVINNLAYSFGPVLGGVMGTVFSFTAVLTGDGVLTAAAAILIAIVVNDSKVMVSTPQYSTTHTTGLWGFRGVLTDRMFLSTIGLLLLATAASFQLFTTLPIVWGHHGRLSYTDIGLLWSINALVVVMLQVPTTIFLERRLGQVEQLVWGTAVYAIGIFLLGVLSTFTLLAGSMLVLTLGEMIYRPASEAVAAQLSPEDSRGRYMAVFGWSSTLGRTMGPIAVGGLLMILPNIVVWSILTAGILATSSGMLLLRVPLKVRLAST